MALLPGSPAIGGGVAGNSVPTTDQRGEPRSAQGIDIGAFQSQGFTITPVSGSTPQSALEGKPFAKALTVTVTAKNAVEPVAGGVVSFAVTPANGASATLSPATAVIADGQAAVNATANGTAGQYTATATAAGVAPVSFVLTNNKPLTLTGPSGPVTTTTPSPSTTQPAIPINEVVVSGGARGLRAAIAYANSHPGPDTIIFDPAVFARKHRTIRIVGGPLVVTDPATTTIIGPGARLLTLKGNGRSGVFDVRGGSLALSGVAITGGRADAAGAFAMTTARSR